MAEERNWSRSAHSDLSSGLLAYVFARMDGNGVVEG